MRVDRVDHGHVLAVEHNRDATAVLGDRFIAQGEGDGDLAVLVHDAAERRAVVAHQGGVALDVVPSRREGEGPEHDAIALAEVGDGGDSAQPLLERDGLGWP